MIKIAPLLANEYKQALQLLTLQSPVIQESEPDESELFMQSLSFWQHWLPCQWHTGPSVYVAREEGLVLGLISLKHSSKSRTCWEIDKLVVSPEHRGQGIAQELLRYVFAQFGSQGVMHFLAEVPALSDAALGLFANCGFCRSARISYYKYNPKQSVFDTEKTALPANYKLALPHLKSALYQLHCDVLPPALRQILLLSPDDFNVKDPIAFTSVEKSKGKLMRNRLWYWVHEDPERKLLSSAVQVSAEAQSGYKLEFAVHPAYKDESEDLLCYALLKLLRDAPRASIWVKVFEFQSELEEILNSYGFERSAEAFLLHREHWQKARKKERNPLPSLSKPVINFPLAAD